MSLKDIVAFMFSAAEDEAALAAGEAMLRSGASNLAAVLVEIQPDPVFTMEAAMVSAMWAEVIAEARKGFSKEKSALAARCKRSERPIVVRELPVTSGLAGADAAVHARHADLSIMTRPGGQKISESRNAVFEGVLFGAGRPVLLVPPEWRGDRLGRKVVVAWNGKREAARALADAAPLLDQADEVAIVTIDAKPGSEGVGPAPGADIAAHLARRGVKVEVRNLDGLGRDDADTLIAGARAFDADLIVMGGYGRTRLSEMVFGGMTRSMTTKSPLPIFISH